MNVIAFEIQCPSYTMKRKQKEISIHIKSNYIYIIIFYINISTKEVGTLAMYTLFNVIDILFVQNKAK